MVNRRISWILCLVAVFGLASIANAQSISRSSRLVTIPTIASAPQGSCGPLTITEGSSTAVTAGNSASCNLGGLHADNSYWRAFLLSDFAIVGNFDVCNVQIGIEVANDGGGVGQPMTVNLYTETGLDFPTGFPADLTLIGTANVTVLDQALTLLDIPIVGTAPAGSQLVVEIFTPDGQAAGHSFFIGSNAAAETNPSYISAAACGITVPTPTAAIGFPDMHIVMNVTGEAITAASLEVDPVSQGGNGVLEMTDVAPIVAPGWGNYTLVDFTLTGTASNLTGPVFLPGDPVYTILDPNADYGTITAGTSKDCLTGTPDCYSINITGTRPVQHFDATIDETVIATLAGGLPSKTWTLHVGDSFSDVLSTDQYYPSIETIFHLGVTVGCGGTSYCPLQNNLRQEMAPFLLKAFLGSTYVPPGCLGIFTDVPCPATVDFPYSDYIEDLWNRAITVGCATQPGPPPTMQYCPDRDISRAEMAAFLLKTLEGGGYVPPACTGLFTDVPCPATPTFPFSDWIEDIFLRFITAGCASQPGPPPTQQFCPDNPVTRQEMAVFLRLTFGLVLYGP